MLGILEWWNSIDDSNETQRVYRQPLEIDSRNTASMASEEEAVNNGDVMCSQL